MNEWIDGKRKSEEFEGGKYERKMNQRMNEWMSEWDIWMNKWMKDVWIDNYHEKKIASFWMHDNSLFFFRRWWSNVKVGNEIVQETAIFCLESTLLRSPIGSPMVISFRMSNVWYQDITSFKSRRSTKFLRLCICLMYNNLAWFPSILENCPVFLSFMVWKWQKIKDAYAS